VDQSLAGQRRYLAARAAAATGGALHENQRAAIDRERALAATATDLDAYRAASGDLFELTRGAWIDRVVGHARIAATIDDPWWIEACRIELGAALAARDASDWRESLAAASDAAAPVRAAGVEAAAAYGRLAAAIVWARVEQRPVPRTMAVAEPAAARRALDARDRTFDPRVLARRYRLRTPWIGKAGETAARWMGSERVAVEGAIPPDREVPPDGAAALAAIENAAALWRERLVERRGGWDPGVAPPSVADVIVPYAALTDLAGDAPGTTALRVAARAMVDAVAGANTAQDVLAIWVERGLDVALARAPTVAALVELRARATIWPEPLLAHHVRGLEEDLVRARTPTEIDLISVHAEACRGVEGDWNRVLAAGLLAPLRAAFIASWDPDPHAAVAVAEAWRTAHALAGTGALSTSLPWIAGVLAALAAHAGTPVSPLGMHQGEVGAELLDEARTAVCVCGARGIPIALDAAALAAHVHAWWGAPPPDQLGDVALWDRRIPIVDLGRDTPARPPLPGR
jgi:hypothetical protein